MNPVQPRQEDSVDDQGLANAPNSSQASQNNLNNTSEYERFGPNEEIVQVVYQSNQNGSLVGVDATLVGEPSGGGQFEVAHHYEQSPAIPIDTTTSTTTTMGDPITLSPEGNASAIPTGQQQLSRTSSTLPPLVEESSTSGGGGGHSSIEHRPETSQSSVDLNNTTLKSDENVYGNYYGQGNEQQYYDDVNVNERQQTAYTAQEDSNPVYSTVNKANQQPLLHQQTITENQVLQVVDPSLPIYANTYSQPTVGPSSDLAIGTEADQQQATFQEPTGNLQQQHLEPKFSEVHATNTADEGKENVDDEDIGHILSRHKAGAVESGSFRHNFRKKLGMSVSTNENDLTAYRQKLLQSQEPASGGDTLELEATQSTASGGGGGGSGGGSGGHSKFKRTHSVSFNVGSSRSNRHSVDIRNLPSYLTHKRASIVDVAKGAMSSLISSLGGSGTGGGGGGSGGGSNLSGGHRRDSSPDDEPIFEEPIAPTLSLGQRVALVRSSGAEFGTVGWIGQLPDVDDDWIVGVIFDNMIGNCDGAYQGNRYFYARENYAMFVPLSMLTKTDNYIGRPETGTMLSRMSIQLKPGQLISIQRSSIRLQHCFLNAPHQRVGHDVRAVSNRLHCQCHNCGPCAHLTKQGRMASMPHFGAHHLSHHTKKNSLAHAAVEMLAHHHHHFHDEEEHEEEDYKFGDNAAHACNYVRYSCCQQNGAAGHEFMNDCGMVRPELLDNLIHAPKAPHRRSRPRRSRANQTGPAKVRAAAATLMIESIDCMNLGPTSTGGEFNQSQFATGALLDPTNQSTLDTTNMTGTLQSSYYGSETTTGGDGGGGYARNGDGRDGASDGASGSGRSSRSSSYSSCSSRSSSSSSSSSVSGGRRREDKLAPAGDQQLTEGAHQPPYNYYQHDSSTYSRPGVATGGAYETMDSQFSIMDQRRFIFQRHSSANIYGQHSYQASEASEDSQATTSTTGGLGRGIMRCFRCFKRRDQRQRARRPPKRKLSAKDRMIEYRRKQSTFVPSTLAKPQDDFASHGIILPSPLVMPNLMGVGVGMATTTTNNNHSDYSSCSKSSASSSRSQSPDQFHQTSGQPIGLIENQQQQQQHLPPQQTVAGSILNSIPDHNEQLKSSSFGASTNAAASQQQTDEPRLNYGDYTFGDGYESHKLKSDLSRDSALTDLGYWDTYKTDSSCDTLKQLVDQSINEQVSLPEPIMASSSNNYNNGGAAGHQRLDLLISPLSSSSSGGGGDQCQCNSPESEQVEVSSPTASTADYPDEEEDNTSSGIARGIENLKLNRDNETL